jgi:GNAT superfamily N-acetyltransferase
MDEPNTRAATADDADAMNALFAAGVETYREFAPDGWRPPVPDSEETRRTLADPATWAMVAVVEDEPVAHVSFLPARTRAAADSPRDWRERPLIPGMAHLWQLFVGREWWGTGVAGILHDEAIAEMRTRGYELGRLFTPAAHPRARRFYERRGWVAVDERYNEDLGLELVEYRLDLRVSSH